MMWPLYKALLEQAERLRQQSDDVSFILGIISLSSFFGAFCSEQSLIC
jgi:hypothetical protein